MMVLSFNPPQVQNPVGRLYYPVVRRIISECHHYGCPVQHAFDRFRSSLIATVIGTAASIAINHMKPVTKTIVMGITNVPMLNADIVTGISLMLTFLAFGISLGFETIPISHITFNIPYAHSKCHAKVKEADQSKYL